MKTLLLITVLLLAVFFGCKKKEVDYPPPTIKFVFESSFVYQDTVLSLGDSFKVGIVADNPDANLTNFIIRAESNTSETFLDSGMNTPSLSYQKTLIKGVSDSVKWIFIIRDREGKSSEISFNVFLDSTSSYSDISYYPSIILDAQNGNNGSFFSLIEDSVYSLETAFLNQDKIDLCYFYDLVETDEHTIASPGANIEISVFPGSNGLQNWSNLRTTRYKIADITVDDFNNAINDSLLLATYGQSDGFRKAKNLYADVIYSFKNEDGKVGLFKVNSISGTDEGSINISVKVQK